MTETVTEPPPEFYGNVIKEMRKHWVDAAAERRGVDPDAVDCALVIGNDKDAEVRINDEVRAAVYVGDDQIVDLDAAAASHGKDGDLRGLVPDVPPDLPYMFFDLRLGYLSFNLQPRRDMAERHVRNAGQFWHAACDLVARGGLNAACENMFAAAELATMALMEVAEDPGFGHRSRSEWLQDHAAGVGLTEDQAKALSELHIARNAYRYGDEAATMSPVSLLERVPHVEAILQAASAAVERPTQ